MTLTPEGYRPRLVDDMVGRMLRTFGAVSIEGPRYCGKTWTAENHANSEFKVADSTGPIPNRDLAAADFRIALEGERPHLIDEWQEVPSIRDRVRTAVDSTGAKGQFILTGSSVPKRKEYVHSGSGRIGDVEMKTMSLYETGDSDGRVSLRSLFDEGVSMIDCGPVTLEHLADLTVRGGWPGALNPVVDAELLVEGYVRDIVREAAAMDGKGRSERKMGFLLRSLARNESTLASNSSIIKDMRESDNETIAVDTFDDYINCLFRMHLLDDTPAYSPNLRSDARVGKTAKRHLTDPSLAVAAMGLNRELLMNDLNTFGFMFESLCEHDLGIYAESIGGKLFHYRDGRGREIDAVVELRDGTWGAFEVKVGAGQIDEAAGNLLKLRGFFEREGKPPAVLCVICGMASYAYRRPDGVFVVPITSLGP